MLNRALKGLRHLALAAVALLAPGIASAEAANFDLNFDLTLNEFNFFDFGTPFFQVGTNLTFSPYGAIALNDGDTARITFNFADGQAVRVTNSAASPTEVSVAFLTAGQLANPGTGPTQVDLTFDFALSFLGASGDLLLPSISRTGVRNIGGGLAPQVSENLTDTSFLFQGVQFEFANIHDNNAASGVTEVNRILPRFFDVTSFRLVSAGGVELGEIAAIPEPSSLALMVLGLLGLGGLGALRRRRRAGSGSGGAAHG